MQQHLQSLFILLLLIPLKILSQHKVEGIIKDSNPTNLYFGRNKKVIPM